MNEKLRKALETGIYECMEDGCDGLMEFDDEETRDSLTCTKCGFGCSIDDYGQDADEVEYRRIADVAGAIQGETYEEVYGDEDDD